MNEPVPFKTTDAVLAQCLTNAGVPEFLPPTNTFTKEILERLGYKGDLLEIARRAWKNGDRGQVKYFFEQVPELPYLLKCYKELSAQIISEEAGPDAGAAIREIMAKAAGRDPVTSEAIAPMDEREAVFRNTFITLKCRTQYVNRWKDYPARLDLPTEGETTRQRVDGCDVEQRPGGVNISLAMSDEKLREMKLL